MPFTETLHQCQRDLYDIDTLLLKPMKKLKKTAKHKTIAWKVVSGLEHSIGVTFGVFAITELYNQRYGTCILYSGLMTVGAVSGFDAGKISRNYANNVNQLNDMINTTQYYIQISLPEQLHEIAEIIRNNNRKQHEQ